MAAVSIYSNGRNLDPHRTLERGQDRWDFSTPANVQVCIDPMYRKAMQIKTPPVRCPNFYIYADCSSFFWQDDAPLSEPPSAGARPSHRNRDPDSPSKRQAHGNSHPPTDPAILDRIEQSAFSGIPASTKNGANFDPGYLLPYKIGQRPGLSESRTNSEPDSLIDLYGHPRSLAGRSMVDSIDPGDQGASQEDYVLGDDDPEHSRWIHRDKLAAIEIQEMQQAGIVLPQPRPSSKSQSGQERGQHRHTKSVEDQDAGAKKRRLRSPQRQEEAEEDETLVNDFDIRTPEEIAADSYVETGSPSMYRQQGLRSSSSRIPLPRSSPMPIPQEHIDRNTPLPRKRGASGNWSGGDEDGILFNRTRSRGNSVGSQVLLDDTEPLQKTPTPTSRPTSRDVSSKLRQPSSYKKFNTSTPSNSTPPFHQKPRSTSYTTTRPKSRSGLEPHPPTAINRPEGDPPWLATMYKPDPRLPPEQQLLPTHAKRIQQEQRERTQKESQPRQRSRTKSPHTTNDKEGGGRQREEANENPPPQREFSPLAIHTRHGLQPAPSREADERELRENTGEWPLTRATDKPTLPLKPENGMVREGGHGGYSTIPRVKGKEGSPGSGTKGPSDPFEKERMERARREEKRVGEEKERGCGCGCSVM